MKEKFFSLFVFAFFAQLLLGQEKFTIRGEFPDNCLLYTSPSPRDA